MSLQREKRRRQSLLDAPWVQTFLSITPTGLKGTGSRETGGEVRGRPGLLGRERRGRVLTVCLGNYNRVQIKPFRSFVGLW